MRLPLNCGWWGKWSDRRASVDEPGTDLPTARPALLAHLNASGPTASDAQRVRETVRELCDDAHRRRLQAEQLLIVIKGAWRSLPETRSGARVPQASLDRFISLCTEEYYARRD
jgi:hypothetical protein